MLSWLHCVESDMKYAGLCHGVQGTTKELATLLDVPYEEVSFVAAGINHLAWILEFRRGKEDLYPRLRALLSQPEKTAGEEVRFEIMKYFGYFCTESNRHDSEYMPYFRRTPELMAHYKLKPREVPDTPRAREWLQDSGMGADESAWFNQLRRSHEYTSYIIEALVTNQPYAFNGNVINTGLITNLPHGCCVEVPCLVDARGIHPTHIGALPPQCAALDRSNVAVHELAVQAVRTRDREAAFLACALDPNAAAILPLWKLRRMFDELWKAEEHLLKWFDPRHTGPLPELCAP